MAVNTSTLAAVYLALLLFGFGYNYLVAWVERKGYMQGYTALFVAGGVLITLAFTAVISPIFAMITFGAFVFSGLPMITGSIWRHVRNREQEIERLRREAQEALHDAPETLA